MQRKKVGATNTTLSYSMVQANQLARLSCQKCRTTLDIFQPNINHPFQFLATCPTCGTWYRVETQPSDPRGVMVSLPEITGLLPKEEPAPKHTA